MKAIYFFMTIIFSSSLAHAHIGSHSVMCQSEQSSSGAKILFQLKRPNIPGEYPAQYSIEVDGKKFTFLASSSSLTYGETFHNSPLGVITVSATNFYDSNAKSKSAFSLVALPQTVKAYNQNGDLVKWNLEDEKLDGECYDSTGKATFKGKLNGGFEEKPGENSRTIWPQILDCEITYDSGMAC